jgi:hypothetical protein
MTRLATLDGPATLFDTVAATRLDRAFNEFHAANPKVYEKLRELSLDLRRRGHQRAGIGMLWEVMRWQTIIETSSDDGFKLNNNLRSRYARMLMDNEPELDGFFEIRELRGS